jgi:hypothetical protein
MGRREGLGFPLFPSSSISFLLFPSSSLGTQLCRSSSFDSHEPVPKPELGNEGEILYSEAKLKLPRQAVKMKGILREPLTAFP